MQSDPGAGDTVAGRRLRILIVVPFPPRRDNHHGGRIVAQLLDSLADRHDVAVVHLDRGGEPPMAPELTARCALVRTIPVSARSWMSPRWRYRLQLASTWLTGRPTAVVAVYDRRLAGVVQAVAEEWAPDIIQFEGDVVAYCAARLFVTGTARALVVHDPGLPSARQLVRMTTGRQHLGHRLDTRIWRRYWRRLLPRMDAVVAFTEADARSLTAAVPGLEPATISLGIDIPPDPMSATGGPEPNVVFIGGYGHTPNIDAALRLMNSIMPKVRAVRGDVGLRIVGENPVSTMYAAARSGDEITGSVTQVGPYLDAASVVALPIALGGGMRVKLLEALGAGKAVVASRIAVAGLALAPSDGVLRIADTDEDFAAAIIDLVQDEPARAELGAAARRWAAENLSWSSRREAYERLYLDLVARTSARTDSAARRYAVKDGLRAKLRVKKPKKLA